MTEEDVVRLYRSHMCYDAMDDVDEIALLDEREEDAPRVLYIIAPGNFGLPCA